MGSGEGVVVALSQLQVGTSDVPQMYLRCTGPPQGSWPCSQWRQAQRRHERLAEKQPQESADAAHCQTLKPFSCRARAPALAAPALPVCLPNPTAPRRPLCVPAEPPPPIHPPARLTA